MVQGQNTRRLGRPKSFHFRYLELCRSKNFPPQSEIKSKSNENQNLEFYGDKFKIDDWILINESLLNDQMLVNITIRLRKNFGNVIESIDNEKKARGFNKKPVIFTKFIFMSFIEALSNCIMINKNLTTINLEGLPLTDKYVQYISNALSANDSIRSLSFARSSIGDKGCESLCDVIKCLPNIEKVNLSCCQLTNEGASHITDMIKFQKIYRYSEGWKQSLRYREVDPDSLQGLKSISIAQNPEIGDEGIQMITEVLKEDVWIKNIDVEECNLTDVGAHYILDCLQINRTILDFSIRGNSSISESLIKEINVQLGKENVKENDEFVQSTKVKTNTKLREKLRLLEEQLASEKSLRKQVDILNEQLHEQLRAYEQSYIEQEKSKIPKGYTLVKQEELDQLIEEKNNLENTLVNLRSHYKRSKPKVRKAKSETGPKLINKHKSRKYSKSEHGLHERANNKNEQNQRIYVETGIGDTQSIKKDQNLKIDYSSKISSIRHYPSRENFCGMDELKVFIKKKTTNENDDVNEIAKNSARAILFGI